MDRIILSKKTPASTHYVGFRWFNGKVFRVDFDLARGKINEVTLTRWMVGEYADSFFRDPAWVAEHFHKADRKSMEAVVAEWLAKGFKVRPELGR